MKSNSVFSIIERILFAGLKFLAIVLLGHWLGASGQGIYSLFIVIWAWTGTFAAMGLGISNNYFGAKDSSPKAISILFGNTVVFNFFTGSLLIVLVWGLTNYTDIFKALPSSQYGVLLVGVLLHSLYVPLQGLLLGLGAFKFKVITTIANFGCFLFLLIWQFAAGTLTQEKIGLDWLISIAIVLFLWMVWLFIRTSFRIRLNGEVFRQQISHGWKSYMYSITNGALLRIDLLLVSFLLGVEAAGIYSVAVYFTEVLLYLPSALTTVLLTAVGSGRRIVKELYRNISTILLCAIITTAFLIPIIVRIVFRPEALNAILPAEIMLIGVYCLGMGSIGAYHKFGTNNPILPFYATLAAVLIEVGLDFIFIPSAGLVGAAFADSIAYIVFGIIILASISRIYNCTIAGLLRPVNPIGIARSIFAFYGRAKQ